MDAPLRQHDDRLVGHGLVHELVVGDDALPTRIVARFPSRGVRGDCCALGHEVAETVAHERVSPKLLLERHEVVRSAERVSE